MVRAKHSEVWKYLTAIGDHKVEYKIVLQVRLTKEQTARCILANLLG